MSSILTHSDQLIICTNDKIILYNTKFNQSNELKIPALELPPNLTKNQQDALKNEKPHILCSSFSSCGKYFATCTLNKQLIVYKNFKVIKNITISRAVSKIRFTPSCDIVIADKTGDVYLYRLSDSTNIPEQLLGHLSMLLDVIVSDDEKYIITCDRDEKIRVSQYPGSYNIESYCLGHEEFVLNLEFCDPDVLVSSSGDGTLRFWDYINGRQIGVVNTNDYVKDKSLIIKFSEFMDNETVDVNYLPITCMKLVKLQLQHKILIVVSLFRFNGLLVFEVKERNYEHIKLVQIIDHFNKLISFDLSDNFLYVLTIDNLYVYDFVDDQFIVKNNKKILEFFNLFKDVINQTNADNISVLYKRKYDNVQEYQERKKIRIEGRNK